LAVVRWGWLWGAMFWSCKVDICTKTVGSVSAGLDSGTGVLAGVSMDGPVAGGEGGVTVMGIDDTGTCNSSSSEDIGLR